jgi:hypothetical protein
MLALRMIEVKKDRELILLSFLFGIARLGSRSLFKKTLLPQGGSNRQPTHMLSTAR